MKSAILVSAPLMFAAIVIPARAMASEVQVIDAFYMSETGKSCNATAKVQTMCKDSASTGVCKVKSDSSLCASDIDPGRAKKLKMKYRCGPTGAVTDFEVTEGSSYDVVCR
jgi:hypothetical protein